MNHIENRILDIYQQVNSAARGWAAGVPSIADAGFQILTGPPVVGGPMVVSLNYGDLKMSRREAALETAPFLMKLIERVDPKIIVFGGNTAFEIFNKANPASVEIRKEFPEETVKTRNGNNEAIAFARYVLHIDAIANPVEAFVVFHPSKGRINEIKDLLLENFARILDPSHG
jgi:uracil-DNA glycosylase